MVFQDDLDSLALKVKKVQREESVPFVYLDQRVHKETQVLMVKMDYLEKEVLQEEEGLLETEEKMDSLDYLEHLDSLDFLEEMECLE